MSQDASAPDRNSTLSQSRDFRLAWLLTLGLFGVFVGAQLAGIEVVGGDPDRFFRPLKSELVRSLKAGELPLWSDRFGFGMPLAAESEVGAFYPPHWVIYSAFGTSLGYRVSQCIHQCMALGFLFLLARKLGALPLGAAMGAMIFVLGGFPAIQASKEWAILGMAWMPAAFLGTEIWFDNGWNRSGRRGLAILSISLTSLALIGHFQMAQLTSLGLALWVATRSFVDRSLFRRSPGLLLAVALAAAIASPQLALSWKYAKEVGATDRSLATLSYYSYPLECLTELAIPLWTRRIAGGPEGPFWTLRNTTRFEAAMFVGTAGLMLAIIGLFSRKDWGKRALPILALIVAGLGIATMPQWSLEGYATLLELPGMGLFRCPGRYGVLAHLGLALAAARGWGRWPNYASGAAILATFAVSGWFLREFLRKPLLTPGLGPKLAVVESKSVLAGFTDPQIFVAALIAFYLFGILIVMSVTRPKLRVLLFLLTTGELAAFYFAGPTRWGWSLGLPESSALLRRLAEEEKSVEVVVMSPYFDNIPVSAGVTTLSAYFGVAMPPPNSYLKEYSDGFVPQDRSGVGDHANEAWANLGVTHTLRVFTSRNASPFPDDPVFKAIQGISNAPGILYLAKIDPPPGGKRGWCWTAKEVDQPLDSQYDSFNRIFAEPRSVPFSKTANVGPHQKFLNDLDPNATVSADVSRRQLNVRHTGTALVVLKRTYDDGWHAIDESSGIEYPIIPVFGGIQAIVVTGESQAATAKETNIRLRYRPESLYSTVPLSLICSISVLFLAFVRGNRKTANEPDSETIRIACS